MWKVLVKFGDEVLIGCVDIWVYWLSGCDVI